MLSIQNLTVEHIKFEYLISDTNLYLLNTENNRMIKTSLEMLEYLENYEFNNEENDPNIDNFIFGPKKRKLSDFHLKEFQLKKSKLDGVINCVSNKYVKIIFILLIVFGICTFPYFFKEFLTSSISSELQISWSVSLGLFVCQLLITCIHEFGHYYYYQKYVQSEKLQVGVLLRYIFMPMFYTNVNFMEQLNKKKQIKIIIAGVSAQLVVNGLLSILLFATMNRMVFLLFFINIFNILMNLIPFLKMDGYWLINIVIGSEDYMKAFKSFLLEKKRIKISEFILGSVNSMIILWVLIIGVNSIFKIINYL